MRPVVIALVSVVFAAEPVRADDASLAVIKKAIEAHGGADNLRKAQSVRGKLSGTMYRDGASITGESEYILRLPGFSRLTTQNVTDDPNKVVGTVANDQVSIKYGNRFVELSSDMQADKKVGLQVEYIRTLIPLLTDKAYAVSLVGEETIGTGKTTRVRVQKEKEIDVILNFDNANGLLVKVAYEGLNFESQKRMKREIVYSDFKAIDGVMRPMTWEYYGDAKLLMKVTVREEKLGQDIKDSEFAKP